MGFYDKGYNPSASAIQASGGTGKALASAFDGVTKVGQIQEDAKKRKDKFDLDKETKLKEETNKKSAISGMRKLHPKTTKDLDDNEVYVLGNKINDVHEDPTNRKVIDIFTAENGDRVGVYDTGKTGKDGKRVYENVSFGKAKDWNKSTKTVSGKSGKKEEKPTLTGEKMVIERAKKIIKKNPNSKAAKEILSKTDTFKKNTSKNSNVGAVSFSLK